LKIYVDNLSQKMTEEELARIFGEYGVVDSVELSNHQFGDRLKAFAYIDMPNDREAIKAMEALYGSTIRGETIKLNQARTGPKDRRHSGRGGGRRLTDPPAI
jgi:RNA recognition motif-containing protein